ncbi:MAG: hypothetical protein V1820_06010 [archaeon]
MKIHLVDAGSAEGFNQKVRQYKPPEVVLDENSNLYFVAGKPGKRTVYFAHSSESRIRTAEGTPAHVVSGSLKIGKFEKAHRANGRTVVLEGGEDLAIYQFFGRPETPEGKIQLGSAEWARAIGERGLCASDAIAYSAGEKRIAEINADKSWFFLTRFPRDYPGGPNKWLENVLNVEIVPDAMGHDNRHLNYLEARGPIGVYAEVARGKNRAQPA